MSATAARKRWDIKSLFAGRCAELALVAGFFALDRASKLAARELLSRSEGVALLPFFHLTYVENTGTVFGMLRGANTFLIVFTALVLTFLAFNWKDFARQSGGTLPLALIAGGALGNLYDRVFLGRVIDFLDFRVWPVFNLADSCICAGAALLALGLWRHGKSPDKETPK